MIRFCECADPGCWCKGLHADILPARATVTLVRIDFDGQPSCPFCEGCAEDALESGVFAELERIA